MKLVYIGDMDINGCTAHGVFLEASMIECNALQHEGISEVVRTEVAITKNHKASVCACGNLIQPNYAKHCDECEAELQKDMDDDLAFEEDDDEE